MTITVTPSKPASKPANPNPDSSWRPTSTVHPRTVTTSGKSVSVTVTDKEKKDISNIKARCFGRLDLLDVAKAIADGFPGADANELSEVMADAARDYLTDCRANTV